MRVCDTDVMVDIVRGYLPAINWFHSLTEPAGAAGFAYMEVISGCSNKNEIERVRALLKPLHIVWPTENDCQQGLTFFVGYRLSHNLGLLDSLIAATVIGRGATLCRFNTKHFAAVPNLIIEQPYVR